MKKTIYKLSYLTVLFALFYSCDDVERVYYNDGAETVLTLSDDNTLNVRGYLGFSFLGRTQVWKRKL